MNANDGAAPGYRARTTLPLRVELRRQLLRRRTAVTLGLLVALPFLLLAAFELGGADAEGGTTLVDLSTAGAANFTVFALFASAGFLLIVVVALFFGDTVASEASWSSLRYLLAAPVPRGRLLRQKALVAGILSVLALVLLPAVSMLVGVVAYGTGDLLSPTGQAMPFPVAAGRLALVPVFLALNLAWVAALALLLSVSTDAPLGAVGGAVLVSIVSQILDSISALGGLRDYLPTHFGNAWAGLLADPVDYSEMASGVLSGLTYAAIFGLLAARRFATRDITS